MRQVRVVLVTSLIVCALGVSPALAQDEVPRVIPFSGVADGTSPISKPVEITFTVYEEAAGGTALFIETQLVTLQSSRHFDVLLGGATPGGLPASLFTANQARFVGIQVAGLPEQTPRVMLASVPYALKAADADMLGGVPASEYVTEGEAGSGNAYTDAQVAAEAAARAAADTTLQSNIDAEAAAGAQGDIDSLAAANTYADAQVAAEAAARSAADTTLQSNIDAEAAARAQGDIDTLAAANTYTDASVAAEAAARSAADTTLQSNIDAEAAARAQGDIDTLAAANTYTDASVAAEAAARSAADTTLQSNIDAEAAARAAADATLQVRVNGSCGAGSSMVSINVDGSVNCVSVDTNSADDITSLSAGTGISISGSGGSRTITNAGDTNAADDITTISGSGGVTVSGSGNSRTIGHSTWSCLPGAAIRSIDSAGVVTCELDDVGGGGSVTRSVNLPLAAFFNVTDQALIDFTSVEILDSAPDFALSNGFPVLEYDNGDGIDDGSSDNDLIGTTFAMPPDYSSGGSLAIRVSKGGHTGNDEVLNCLASINGSPGSAFGSVSIGTFSNTLYVLSLSSFSASAGDSVGVRCNFALVDDNVLIHSVAFRYTATP